MCELKFITQVKEFARKLKDIDIKNNNVTINKNEIADKYINSSLLRLKIIDEDKENIQLYCEYFIYEYILWKEKEGLKHKGRIKLYYFFDEMYKLYNK